MFSRLLSIAIFGCYFVASWAVIRSISIWPHRGRCLFR